MDWLAAANIVDRPLSVSEWNVEPFPIARSRYHPALRRKRRKSAGVGCTDAICLFSTTAEQSRIAIELAVIQ